MFTRILFLIVLLSISISSLFAAIRLPWGIDEAIDTGFIAPKIGSKDVNTPEGCRKISGVGVTKDYFVPTKTTTEWNAFKVNIPTGISIGLCGPLTYSWKTGNWSPCSLSCGGWTMNGNVWCERSDGMKVANMFCPAASRPPASQSCNTASCSGCVGMQYNHTYQCSPSDRWNYFSIGSCSVNGAKYDIYNGMGRWAYPCGPAEWSYFVTNLDCICTSSTPVSTPIPWSVNGSCGSANNVNTTTQPSSNLCTVGVATEVSQTGSIWAWSCLGVSGGSNANCSALNAPPSIPGVCGSAGGTCVTGGVTADSGPVSGMANYRTWTCLGQYGGANTSCSSCYPDKTATYQGCTISGVNDIYNKRSYGSTIQTGSWMFGAGSPRCFEPAFSCAYGVPPVPVNGVCGATPATCSVGAMTSDNGQTACSTTRTWTCAGANGWTNASCNKVNPVCPPTTYNETNVMRMGDAETNSLEWSINLRTGVANYWSGFRWGNPFKFTLLSWFTPQSVATMASYSKVAVSIEREGRPGSWNGRRWWHLPYQVQAPTALNDWTTIWRVDRKGGGSTDGQWSMKMTTLTGPYEYMFVSVYKHSEPVMLDPFTLAPISFDPTAVTNKNKVQALGSTTVAQVNYNTTTPEWSKTYAPLSDCVVPSTLDPNGFCPSGWAPTKTVPSSSVCGGATGNGKTEDTTFPYITFEPKLIMTQICRR